MHFQQTQLGQVPGIQLVQAWSLIQRKVREFIALEGELADKHHRAAIVSGEARKRGDEVSYRQARTLVDMIGKLRMEYDGAAGYLDRIRALVPGAGLGLIPVPIILIGAAGTVIALSIMITSILRKSTERETELRLLEEGVLSQEEIIELRRTGRTRPTGLAALPEATRNIAIALTVAVAAPLLLRAFKK